MRARNRTCLSSAVRCRSTILSARATILFLLAGGFAPFHRASLSRRRIFTVYKKGANCLLARPARRRWHLGGRCEDQPCEMGCQEFRSSSAHQHASRVGEAGQDLSSTDEGRPCLLRG
ncbi:Hypothetical Protein RRSL_02209 [Ralstonia solanacearum UW551]|uniref:Secreted protein n=2 Tax=Ralstonia solanacearum TaxID=305 RepID=A0ABF7RBY8_RALSL|nr:Hypothetical Protein RRSL_02209 [Ralstonia solanacearum UW551]CEJ18890.1 hypothetical protein RSIPO_04986 [Ralstonia solanacearum IPO1609]